MPARFAVYPDLLEKAGYHVGVTRKGWGPGRIEPGSGVNDGMKLQDVRVPTCLPDDETVRSDLCDYYWEVQRFDREVSELLGLLEARGDLDNTLVVVTGDNGLPFLRCKSNRYDLGTHVPLAIRWPSRVPGGRIFKDFVSLQDLAPTFIEAASLRPPLGMTGHSLIGILTSDRSEHAESGRDHENVHAGARG